MTSLSAAFFVCWCNASVFVFTFATPWCHRPRTVLSAMENSGIGLEVVQESGFYFLVPQGVMTFHFSHPVAHLLCVAAGCIRESAEFWSAHLQSLTATEYTFADVCCVRLPRCWQGLPESRPDSWICRLFLTYGYRGDFGMICTLFQTLISRSSRSVHHYAQINNYTGTQS